jgi:hypothetical protein
MRPGWAPWPAAVVVALALIAPSTSAQTRLRAEGGVIDLVLSVNHVRMRTQLVTGLERQSGVSLAGEGTVWLGRVGVRAGYLEGRLGRQGTLPRQKQVEGFALLAVMPIPGLLISGGPHARAFRGNGITNRWVFWTLRTSYEVAILRPAVRGFGEAWGAVTGSSSVAEPFGSALGGSAGLLLELVEEKVALRLAYGIDESRLGAGRRRDTIENVTLGVGLRIR